MFGCCSPLVRLVKKISGLLSALAAISMGLRVFGYDAISMLKLHDYGTIINYVFGIAGIISLLMVFSMCNKGDKNSSCPYCTSGSCNTCQK